MRQSKERALASRQRAHLRCQSSMGVIGAPWVRSTRRVPATCEHGVPMAAQKTRRARAPAYACGQQRPQLMIGSPTLKPMRSQQLLPARRPLQIQICVLNGELLTRSQRSHGTCSAAMICHEYSQSALKLNFACSQKHPIFGCCARLRQPARFYAARSEISPNSDREPTGASVSQQRIGNSQPMQEPSDRDNDDAQVVRNCTSVPYVPR
eukprot:COSAG01_NODE_1807_length_9189_cov_24.677778_7_plen_209_part_00